MRFAAWIGIAVVGISLHARAQPPAVANGKALGQAKVFTGAGVGVEMGHVRRPSFAANDFKQGLQDGRAKRKDVGHVQLETPIRAPAQILRATIPDCIAY